MSNDADSVRREEYNPISFMGKALGWDIIIGLLQVTNKGFVDEIQPSQWLLITKGTK